MNEGIDLTPPGKIWKAKIYVRLSRGQENNEFAGDYEITAPADANGKPLVASF